MSRLLIVATEEGLPSALRLRKLGEFLGCGTELISIGRNSTDAGPRLQSIRGESAVALSADTLIFCCKNVDLKKTIDLLQRENGCIFVYDWHVNPAHVGAIVETTNGSISAIEPIGNDPLCGIPAESQPYTLQLAGTEYAAESGDCEAGFVLRPTGFESLPLLTRGKLSTFIRMKTHSGTLFLSAAGEIADLDETASREFGLRKKYSGLLPYLLFIRATFGDACWQGPLQTARLIIDDPVLKRRYGFLEFDQLFRSMDSFGYASTVAFIPWNYKRTSRRAAQYFSAQRSTFSTCVHGCDHTNGEFANRDAVLLRQRAVLALKRMSEHEARTSVPCERVMVFPQGIFSRIAAGALRSSGYLAAINSTTVPIDNDDMLKVRDLLAPAVTSLQGFPIFIRHYPNSTFDLAFDLYLGRPAFIVEHHDFFENGLPALESLLRDLQRRSPRLQWLPLESAVEKTHQIRTCADSETHLRFFTDTFELENTTNRSKRWKLIRPDPDSEFVRSVLVNGASVPFNRTGDGLEFEVELQPRQTARLRLELSSFESKSPSFGSLYSGKVLLRRGLSEFRDEVLSRHPALSRAAKRIVNVLGATGDSAKM